MLPHIHNEIWGQHEFLMINSSQWPVKKQTKLQITNTKINLFKEKATTLYMFENYKMTIKIVLHAIIIIIIIIILLVYSDLQFYCLTTHK